MARTYPGLKASEEDQWASAVAVLYFDDTTGFSFDDSDITGNLFTIAGNTLVDFNEVTFIEGVSLPPELVGLKGFVRIATPGSTFRVAATLDDARNSIFITPTTGSGTGHSIDSEAVSVDSGIEYVAAREVPNANNYARQSVPPPTFVIDRTTDFRVEASAPVNVSFTATPASIIFSGIAILKDASTTYGSTAGETLDVTPGGGTIAPGPAQAFTIDAGSMNRLSTDTGVF